MLQIYGLIRFLGLIEKGPLPGLVCIRFLAGRCLCQHHTRRHLGHVRHLRHSGCRGGLRHLCRRVRLRKKDLRLACLVKRLSLLFLCSPFTLLILIVWVVRLCSAISRITGIITILVGLLRTWLPIVHAGHIRVYVRVRLVVLSLVTHPTPSQLFTIGFGQFIKRFQVHFILARNCYFRIRGSLHCLSCNLSWPKADSEQDHSDEKQAAEETYHHLFVYLTDAFRFQFYFLQHVLILHSMLISIYKGLLIKSRPGCICQPCCG